MAEPAVAIHDPDPTTEDRLLASMFWRTQDEVQEVRALLRPSSFATPENRVIYGAMTRILDRGDLVDVELLRIELERMGRLEDVGGLDRLAVLMGADEVTVDPLALARYVHAEETRREVVRAAQDGATTEEILGAVTEVLRGTDHRTGGDLEFLSESEIEQLDDAEMLAGPVLPIPGMGMLYGPSTVGKTFVIVDAGGAIQREAASVFGPTRQGQVVIVAGEGALGLKKRLRAWRSYHDAEPAGLLVMRECPRLTDEGSAARLRQALRSLPEPPALLVFDTYNTTSGGSENDGEDVRPFLDACRSYRDEFGCCVLWTHHPNKGGEDSRGHTSLFDDADFVLKMVAEGEHRTRIECKKMKDAPPFDPIHLELVKHGDSMVMTRAKEAGPQADRRDAPEYIRATLRQLQRSTPDGEALSTSKWEAIVTDELDRSSSTFYGHRKMLIECGFVEPIKVGRGVRNRVTKEGKEWLA